MLLIRNRNVSLLIGFFFTFSNIFLFIYSLNFLNYEIRLGILLYIAGTSLAMIELLTVVQQTDAITPILMEHQDQQLLFSLFEKATGSPPSSTPQSNIESISLSELPIDHYLFWGTTASEMRNRLLGSILARYSDAKVLNYSDDERSKAIINAALTERKQTKDYTKAIILFSDVLPSPTHLDLNKIGVYWFIKSTEDLIQLQNKFLDSSTIHTYSPGSIIPLGLYRDGKIYEIKP